MVKTLHQSAFVYQIPTFVIENEVHVTLWLALVEIPSILDEPVFIIDQSLPMIDILVHPTVVLEIPKIVVNFTLGPVQISHHKHACRF